MPATVPTVDDLQAVADRLTALAAALGGTNSAVDKLNQFAADTAAYLADVEQRLRRLEDAASPPAAPILYGTCVNQTLTGLSAQAQSDELGGIGVYRVFKPGTAVGWSTTGAMNVPTGCKMVWYSEKPAPATVASGADDARITGLLNSWPTNVGLIYTIWHEPEDNIRAGNFTLADWRAAQSRAAKLVKDYRARTGRADVMFASIWMDYTFDPKSGRYPNDYYVPDVDLCGVDFYNTAYITPALTFIQGLGKRWGIGEYGIAGGTNVAPYNDDQATVDRIRLDASKWLAFKDTGVAVCLFQSKGNLGVNVLTKGTNPAGVPPHPASVATWSKLVTTGQV